ncbi:MAG: YDG domain-containing protein [Christensenellales bacterium]
MDKDAGTGKVVSVQGLSLVGADAEYYTLITPIFTADIVRRPLTLQNVAIADKGYDGTAAANVSNIDLVGVLEGESVSVDYLNAKAAFISPDRGENVAAFVTNLQLQGADSHNYSLLETTAMASGRIVTMPSIDRVYSPGGQCTLSLDGLGVMPSMLSRRKRHGTAVAVANDIPLPEKRKPPRMISLNR